MDRKDTTKAAFFVIMATFFSKVLGFLREILLGSQFGATSITDAYLIAITIPNIIFASLVGALATTYIPVYSKVKLDKGEEGSIRFTNNVLNTFVLGSVILLAFGMIFTRPVVSFIAMGFDSDTLDLSVRFTRIIFPMILFIGAAYIFTGFLQSNNEFTIPALINVPNNLLIVIVLAFSSFFGILGLLYATLIGALFQVILQLPFAFKKGFRYKFVVDLNDSDMRQVGILALPVLAGTSVQQVNALVDRMLASGLAEGSISALNFANKLNGFVFGLFSLSISTVIYPLLSHLNAKNDIKEFKNTFISAINVITLVTLPITVGAVVLRTPIVSVLFQRGEFDQRATMLTATALLYYSLGMIFYGYRDILNRVFYSLHDTKTPMINGVIALICNIVLNLILVRYMQLGGLALATSIAAAITTVLLFISLRKKLGSIGLRRISVVAAKSSTAALLMGIALYYMNQHIFDIMKSGLVGFASLLLMILAGALIYFIIIYLLKVEEINWMFRLIKSKRKN